MFLWDIIVSSASTHAFLVICVEKNDISLTRIYLNSLYVNFITTPKYKRFLVLMDRYDNRIDPSPTPLIFKVIVNDINIINYSFFLIFHSSFRSIWNDGSWRQIVLRSMGFDSAIPKPASQDNTNWDRLKSRVFNKYSVPQPWVLHFEFFIILYGILYSAL